MAASMLVTHPPPWVVALLRFKNLKQGYPLLHDDSGNDWEQLRLAHEFVCVQAQLRHDRSLIVRALAVGIVSLYCGCVVL